MNGASLLIRVKRSEQLTKPELDFVRRSLRDGNTQDDTYTLIHVLWKSYDPQSRNLIWAHATDSDEMVGFLY